MANTFERQLEQLRTEIAGVKEQIEWLQAAPVPLTEAKAQASAAVRALAKDSRLPDRVGYLASPGCNASVLAGSDDLVTLLSALAPEIVESGLHRLLDERYAFLESGPALKDRPKLKRELEERLFRLEVQEEILITGQERETGEVRPRRSDCDPAIILAVDLEAV